MSNSENFVIIGASHAGVQLAASLRDTGFAGSITMISDDDAVPYHRPPLSKAYLKDVDAPVQVLRAPNYYDDNNIKLLKPRWAKKIDVNNSTVEMDNGDLLPFTQLCLTTGARPRALDIPGIDASGVYELRNSDDAVILRQAARNHKTAVVVGGGFIGLEAAATLHGLGMDVSVVEAAPRLMGRAVAPEISEYVLNKYRDMGIKVHLDTPISAIETNDGAASAVVCNGQHYAADMVLIGIGVVPNDELATDAGLKTGNGIHVDQFMATSVPNIYAIGDVASYGHWQVDQQVRLESVQNATDQARALAKTIAGDKQPYRAVPWFWSEQGGMKIQMVGLNHNSVSRVTRENPEKGSFSAFHFDKDNNLVAIDTINAPADHMAGRKLIAGGISPTAEQASDASFALKSLL